MKREDSRFTLVLKSSFPRSKRSQISIFIIVAIVLVLVIVLFVFFRINKSKENVTLVFENIHNFIDECVKKTSKDSVYYVSTTGGYYEIPKLSTLAEIAYYYDGNKNLAPSLNVIENQISLAFDGLFNDCVNNYENFKDYKIEKDNIKSKVKITDDKVLFDVDYSVKISKGNNVVNFNKFDSKVDVRLKNINIVSNEIVDSIVKNNGGICLNCLFEISKKYDFYVEMYDVDLDTTVFVIRDKNFKLYEEDFIWYFASKN